SFFLAKGIHEQFALDVGAQPLVALDHLGFGMGYFFFVEKFAEVQQHGVVHFKILRDLVRDGVALGKVKQRIVLQQRILELVGLVRRQLHVGSDAATAIHGTPTIGELDFVVGVILLALAIVVVIVERKVRVIALDETSAGGVVLGGGQGKAGIFGERKHGLHQALAEGDFTDNQAAIVILNGAGDNLGCRSRAAIHQHHQWIFLASVAVGCHIPLFG